MRRSSALSSKVCWPTPSRKKDLERFVVFLPTDCMTNHRTTFPPFEFCLCKRKLGRMENELSSHWFHSFFLKYLYVRVWWKTKNNQGWRHSYTHNCPQTNVMEPYRVSWVHCFGFTTCNCFGSLAYREPQKLINGALKTNVQRTEE